MRRFFRTALVAVGLLIGYAAATAEVADPLHLYLGLAMLVLACVPALQWARHPTTQFPAFEVFMGTAVNTFALPLLSGHELLRSFPAETISAAAWGVLLFQLTALTAFAALHPRVPTTRFWTVEIIPEDIAQYLRYGLLLTTAYTGFYTFTQWIPYEYNSALRAIFFGLGTLCTFLLGRRLGAGQLSGGDRLVFVVATALQVLFLAASLYLIGALSVVLLALMGYVAGARRLPVLPAVAIFALLAVLHNGKAQMRSIYWTVEEQRIPALAELPRFYGDWLAAGLERHAREDNQAPASIAQKLIDRTSLIHILCLVVHWSPERQPFLKGETYGHIIPQLIPRYFWPEKPLGHVSTHRLSTYYGLQDETAVATTTIGFGPIAEAYANFGYWGLGGLGLIIGGLGKLLARRTCYSPILSYPGLFMVLVMAWSFQTELPVSAWLASLFQASVAVLGIPFVLRRFIG
ncbi:MAG TPA: hypothetical protein VHF69_02835 [Candidatus Synoicihabitans sp.]|nr:hypothetical protein [Candidatus Synoicihabitans sp.]